MLPWQDYQLPTQWWSGQEGHHPKRRWDWSSIPARAGSGACCQQGAPVECTQSQVSSQLVFLVIMQCANMTNTETQSRTREMRSTKHNLAHLAKVKHILDQNAWICWNYPRCQVHAYLDKVLVLIELAEGLTALSCIYAISSLSIDGAEHATAHLILKSQKKKHIKSKHIDLFLSLTSSIAVESDKHYHTTWYFLSERILPLMSVIANVAITQLYLPASGVAWSWPVPDSNSG